MMKRVISSALVLLAAVALALPACSGGQDPGKGFTAVERND